MPWTKGEEELLTQYFREGLPHSQIGGLLGRSRNAVIGKVHRMGLHKDGYEQGFRRLPTSGKHSIVKPRQRMPRSHKVEYRIRDNRLEATPLRWVDRSAEAPNTTHNCSLVELQSTSCRFPIGDPQDKNFHYCGNTKEGTTPYCHFHARLCYLTPAQARARKEAHVAHQKA